MLITYVDNLSLPDKPQLSLFFSLGWSSGNVLPEPRRQGSPTPLGTAAQIQTAGRKHDWQLMSWKELVSTARHSCLLGQGNKLYRVDAAVSRASSAGVTKDGRRWKWQEKPHGKQTEIKWLCQKLNCKAGGEEVILLQADRRKEKKLDSVTIPSLPVNVLQLRCSLLSFLILPSAPVLIYRAHSGKCAFPYNKCMENVWQCLPRNDSGKMRLATFQSRKICICICQVSEGQIVGDKASYG